MGWTPASEQQPVYTVCCHHVVATGPLVSYNDFTEWEFPFQGEAKPCREAVPCSGDVRCHALCHVVGLWPHHAVRLYNAPGNVPKTRMHPSSWTHH